MPLVSIIKEEMPVQREGIIRMVKQAVDRVGGIEKYVKSGDAVVIKPNLFAPFPPPISVDRRVMRDNLSWCLLPRPKLVVYPACQI